MSDANVQGVFAGQRKSILDEHWTWIFSIFRKRAIDRLPISAQGLEGDRLAQPHHGGPDAAICVHLMDQYAFWSTVLGMELKPGYFGENVTLGNITEDQICVGTGYDLERRLLK